MKKLVLVLAVLFTVAMVSCGNLSKKATSNDSDSTTVDSVQVDSVHVDSIAK